MRLELQTQAESYLCHPSSSLLPVHVLFLTYTHVYIAKTNEETTNEYRYRSQINKQ